MRFQKMKLTGFKSFVDPTDIVIADGLTGVVGPNGCGKSNLLEALRWAMGENRPKAMRGAGMEDVIFAGAASRPARSFAEVVLQIDNSDRLAPAGFNDSDTLEIVRRITRDAGSAYRLNGKDVRARDVQMLFADASTGAHSPALVRQGQISELINARPRNRRRILEEAAGISGLYQRRHEAELKLKSTESNLARVDDVLSQLASQLAQLSRQARQAARYRALGDSIRQHEGQLLYRRWKDADMALRVTEEELRGKLTEAARAEAEALDATRLREKRDTALPPLREEDAIAAAVVQRLSVERAKCADRKAVTEAEIERLDARAEQLAKDIAREVGLNRDAEDTIARLEQEARELSQAREGQDERHEAAAEAARVAAANLAREEVALADAAEDAARLAARHQSALRLLDDMRMQQQRSAEQANAARSGVATSRTQLAQAEADLKRAHEAADTARQAIDAAEARITELDEARQETQTAEARARAERSEAEGEATALRAEIQALSRMLERDRGVSGQLLDRLAVAPGIEKALGAALADDLRAPEVEPDAHTGWVDLPIVEAAAPLPEGAIPLATYITAPGVLDRRLAQIGLIAAGDGARAQAALKPGQRLVSKDGDLWRWDGYRAGAQDASTAAAHRLEQKNRLGLLEKSLDDVSRRVDESQQAHDALVLRLRTLTDQDKEARSARRAADQRFAEASRALNNGEAERNLAQGRLESFGQALTRHEEDAATAARDLHAAQQALDELPDLSSKHKEQDALKARVETARASVLALRGKLDELRREADARERRANDIAQEIERWRGRLETAEQRASDLDTRKRTCGAELEAARRLLPDLRDQAEELDKAIEKAEARRRVAADALALAEESARDAERVQRDAERRASEAREARAGAQARAESAAEVVSAAAVRIEEELEVGPEKLLETLGIDPDALAEADRIEQDLSQLKRQRDALGAVNLRAEEDSASIKEEHDTLSREKTDLEDAVRTLRSGIASLNREGRQRLLSAFEQVNENFARLFTHLFGGGEAKLVLVESEDPLEAGLEIMCQPPGKKLSTLSLLSGGEQTLTALALIFAVFLANPAPICVLDEVDAPLDDANVTRFCDLLDEMCRRTRTRFMIITHHAVTMARMDRLFGVTMQEKGVSQLVSVDLKKAEKLVA